MIARRGINELPMSGMLPASRYRNIDRTASARSCFVESRLIRPSNTACKIALHGPHRRPCRGIALRRRTGAAPQVHRLLPQPSNMDNGTAMRMSEPMRSNSVRNSSTLSPRHCEAPRR